ncbi:lysylphosphatidylglycerol synthase transmembrane domain-containing protein [Magnetovibrio sp.]|uniref:lysylphosphatidylglycerol synthase transmembrane domain-containing protein n=1 Tax=Magnetovibrio sp. TaxID=2024836 RepID=UPI002F94B46C
MINRHRAGLILKFVISAALVWALMHAVGGGDAVERMLDLRPEWLAVALILGFVQTVVGALRWRAVLIAIKAHLPWWQLFRFTYIGAFFNQTLPSAVGGDAVRGYMAYRSGLAMGPSVNGVLLDRIATVLALVMLVAVMTPFGVAELNVGDWFARTVWLVSVLAVAGVATIMVLDRLPLGLRRFRLVAGLSVLATDARCMFLQPGHALHVMFWSALGHVNLSAIIFVLAMGLGVDITLVDCLLLFPPVLLAQTLPISLAGWGVREGAMVAMFALAGVGAQSALAISILYGFVMILASLPGSAFWLAAGRKTVEQAEAFAER